MLTVCCAIIFGAFVTTDALAQGSTCETAVAVTPGAYTADGPADGVSEDPCFAGAGLFADWYSFTPAENGVITVSSCLGGADTQVQILEGICGALSCVATADDVCLVSELGSSFAAEVVDVPVIGGTTYYIQWDNQWEDFGFDWTLSFTGDTEPDCEGVIGGPAVPGTACDDGDPSTVGDTYGEDCVCAGLPLTGDCLNTSAFGSADLTDANSEVVTISTGSWQTEYSTITNVPAGEDIQFAIVEGGYITVRSDSASGPIVAQGTSPVTVFGTSGADLFPHWNVNGACETATDGVETTVQCLTCGTDCPDGNIGDPCEDGDPATEGETIQADCSCAGGVIPPPNDDCVDVNSALACGQTIAATTDGASPEADFLGGCEGFSYLGSPSLWYAFQADGTSSYTVTVAPDTSAFSWDGVMYVYSGVCGSLVEEGCSDTTFTGGTEAVELLTPAAGIYYVLVHDYSGSDDFTITLDCDDNCSDPFPAVDPASLSTTQLANGFLTEWDAVAGQVGCQIQARLAGATALLGAQIIGGTTASSFVIPFSVLQPSTDYEWRVRCGCSQTPIVAGPFSAWQPFTTPGAAIASMPNPTEGQSNVTFTVLEEGYTTLEVFDMSGRLVDAIFTGNAQPNNEYRFEFDGSALPNGVYIYRLTTDNEVVNDKFMIAK